jgi:hypothetical protein
VLVGVQLRSLSPGTTSVQLAIEAQSELIGAYPWSSTIPTSEFLHAQDQVSYDPGTGALQFTQPQKPWYGLVGAAIDRDNSQAGFESLGASALGPAGLHNGATGRLTYRVALRGGSDTTVWFAIAGSNVAQSEASWALSLGLAFPEALLHAKISERQEVLSQSQIHVSDPTIQAAFDWGKLNLADMRRIVRNVMVRDTQEGTVFPSPINPIPIPVLSGFGAGYPDYPWFFGTDGAYTTFSLTAVGQWDAAKDHLNSIRQLSQIVNGATGKVLHEIVTNGSVYFGTNAQPGDTNETPEFATAVATLWRWSGDNSVRDQNYDFMKAGMHYVTTQLDTNGDGWPEGAGMVEATGMGAEKLDVAVYTIRALKDLAEMAESKGDLSTQTWARQKADTLKSHFDQDWWMQSQGLFADSLGLPVAVATDPLATLGLPNQTFTQLQQLFWINATPMETSVALPQHAALAFSKLESPDFTGTGFYQQAAVGGRQASAVNTGVMAVAEANYGRVDESLTYVSLIARELDVEQPGALPEEFDSPDHPYFPSFGGTMVMQAWSSYGIHWPLVDLFLGIKPNAAARSLAVVPDLPSTWPQLSIDQLRVGSGEISVSARHSGKSYVTTVTGPAGWRLTIGHTLPAHSQIESVTLDSSPASFQIFDTNRGREVHVRTNTGGKKELTVQAK